MLDKLNLSLSAQLPVGEGIAATNCASTQFLGTSASVVTPSAAVPSIVPATATLFPNPVDADLTVDYTNDYVGKVDIFIYDMNGRTITTLKRDKVAEQLRTVLEVGHLASGMYQIRIISEGQPVVVPFIKR